MDNIKPVRDFLSSIEEPFPDMLPPTADTALVSIGKNYCSKIIA